MKKIAYVMRVLLTFDLADDIGEMRSVPFDKLHRMARRIGLGEKSKDIFRKWLLSSADPEKRAKGLKKFNELKQAQSVYTRTYEECLQQFHSSSLYRQLTVPVLSTMIGVDANARACTIEFHFLGGEDMDEARRLAQACREHALHMGASDVSIDEYLFAAATFDPFNYDASVPPASNYFTFDDDGEWKLSSEVAREQAPKKRRRRR